MHPFLTTEMVTKMLKADSRVFARVDLVAVYHQDPLAEESQLFTTFLISAGKMSGRYTYNRFTMGMMPSDDWCCYHTDVALEGVPGAYKWVDDVIVQAKNMKQLEERLDLLFVRLKKYNIVASSKKFVIGSTIIHGGCIIGSINGGTPTCGPNPDHLQGIKDRQRPTCKKSVLKILGMFRTLSSFNRDCALITPHLC